MMKKLFFTGMLACALTFALMFAGCDTDGDEETLPELTGSVSITGTAKVGQTLTASPELDGTGTIFYVWNEATRLSPSKMSSPVQLQLPTSWLPTIRASTSP
jgi:hypothetical protein